MLVQIKCFHWFRYSPSLFMNRLILPCLQISRPLLNARYHCQLTRMVALFLLALLLQHVLARDTSQDGYIIQKIDSCPDEGYFFKRDLKFNSIEPSCYLCFCKDNGTAICWSRENKRCDKKYYYHTGKRKREFRSRRSPGLSDIFFRDASRDFFNKRIPEQCKPFESSFSEGCPPADWCIGCTVCDCDANGRWDCHVLSFCPDGNGKKQMKKRRSSKIIKRQLTTKKEREKKTTTKTTMKPTRKNVKKINKGKPKTKQNKVKQINGKQKKQQQKHTNLKVKPKRRVQQKKPKAPLRKEKVSKVKTNCKNQGKSKKLVLKSNKSKDSNITKNDSTAKFAETILKKVMASVEKFINESQKNLTTSTQSKIIKKRSMSKHKNGNLKNSVNIDSNKIKSKILNKKLFKKISIKKANEKIKINSRRKREISSDQLQEMSNKSSKPTTLTNPTTQVGYYTYKLDLKDENTTKQNNPVTTDENYVLSTLYLTTHIEEENTTQRNVTIMNKIQRSPKVLLNVNIERNISQISFRINDTSYRTPETCGKICELKKTIRKLFGSFSKSNTTRFKSNKVKVNSFNTLANLKKVFKNIFLKKTNFKNITVDGKLPLRKREVIKALCKNISSCKRNYNNKELQLKLDKLRAESFIILKSVRVLKGLLKLLDINETKGSASKNKQFADNDVMKVNVIINDEYRAKYGLFNLTETQLIQINYIKENTLVFIKSVEKFSYILNDIIKILTNGNKRIGSHRFSRNQVNSKINNSDSVSGKLERITNLLVNYNLVQNKFMKRMYDVLATLRHKANNKTVDDNLKEVSVENKKSNCTDTVEIYTKNIFTNLRKLKHLAQRMNSKTRKKRSTIDNDEAVEYLLMLMEYLFKQNKPAHDSPVTDGIDGIDLLIEAIKNAPDIKSIKNKLLSIDNLQRKQSDANVNLRRNNLIDDKNNVTLKFFEQKFKPFESKDDDRDDFHDNKDLNKETESTTHANIIEKEVTETIRDILIKKPFIDHVIENNKLDILHEKEMNKDKDGVKRYDMFNDDTEEDDTPLDTTTTVLEILESSTLTNDKKPLRTSSPDKNLVNNYEMNHSNNNQIKLDWVEETDDNEHDRENITQINEMVVTQEITTQANEKATRTIRTIRDKYADPVSSMSHEEGEGKVNNINPENESFKKQMNLLNSLDYGTEKTFIDSDSREDKYNVDSSPLYFV